MALKVRKTRAAGGRLEPWLLILSRHAYQQKAGLQFPVTSWFQNLLLFAVTQFTAGQMVHWE